MGMSSRYHRRIASGVTMQPSSRSTFLEIVDDLLMLSIEQTGERNQYDKPRTWRYVAFVESVWRECGT
jgi:hypothetical protein